MILEKVKRGVGIILRPFLNTSKYRNVGIYLLTPENVKGRISPWLNPFWSWETCDYVIDYVAGIDTWECKIAKRAMEADTSYLLSLGHTLEEIEEANQTVPEAWRMERKVLLYKTAWDPRYTSERIYPELEALGVPKHCYHPDYNPYRGCGRGTF